MIPFKIWCGHCSCPRSACNRSASRPRSVNRTRAPRCSASPRCTGLVPGGRAENSVAGAAGAVRADQGSRRRSRRALLVPVGHPADRLAVRGLRRPAGGRHPGRVRPRTGRPVRGPHRQAPGADGSSESTSYRSDGRIAARHSIRWSTRPAWRAAPTSPTAAGDDRSSRTRCSDKRGRDRGARVACGPGRAKPRGMLPEWPPGRCRDGRGRRVDGAHEALDGGPPRRHRVGGRGVRRAQSTRCR